MDFQGTVRSSIIGRQTVSFFLIRKCVGRIEDMRQVAVTLGFFHGTEDLNPCFPGVK
jgi:hypothetical protein